MALVRETAVLFAVPAHYVLTRHTSRVPAVQPVMMTYASTVAVLAIQGQMTQHGNQITVQPADATVMDNLDLLGV